MSNPNIPNNKDSTQLQNGPKPTELLPLSIDPTDLSAKGIKVTGPVKTGEVVDPVMELSPDRGVVGSEATIPQVNEALERIKDSEVSES